MACGAGLVGMWELAWGLERGDGNGRAPTRGRFARTARQRLLPAQLLTGVLLPEGIEFLSAELRLVHGVSVLCAGGGVADE
jgi:hypothetical protein